VAVFRKVVKKSKGGADFGQIAVLLTLLLQRGFGTVVYYLLMLLLLQGLCHPQTGKCRRL
jgi:hypothetical protein